MTLNGIKNAKEATSNNTIYSHWHKSSTTNDTAYKRKTSCGVWVPPHPPEREPLEAGKSAKARSPP